VDEFADMYAQTLTYGMFAARVEMPDHAHFDRLSANRYLPQTNPFLQNFFWQIAGPMLPDTVAWLVDDLAQLLALADMGEVLRSFGKRTKQEEPIIHFYETFLREYDPKLRQQRGVYYTPEPVVDYIVRSLDQILQTYFNRPLGLADPDTLILDPATGTGTFLYFIMQHIHDKLHQMGMGGAWNEYVGEKLLPRLFGFELLMAPYAVAHLKLGLLLRELGYNFGSNERLNLFLTNALDPAVKDALPMGFAGMISTEGRAAARVKTEEPIMVILGNPPYSVSSSNKSEYIDKLMKIYKKAVRRERNIQPLSDDYIKFIRYAHDRIERTGYGVVGMITNHTYLNGLIHRGMREELMKSFSHIYVLDLHGSALLGLQTPDGDKDENVFDIRQGVAIVFLIKKPNSQTSTVYHSEMWGKRDKKYLALYETQVDSTPWRQLAPDKPYYFFTPKNFELREEYEPYVSVSRLFNSSTTGFATHRDKFAIGFTLAELQQKIHHFRSNSVSDDDLLQWYGLRDTRDWKLTKARSNLKNDGNWDNHFQRCAYRPFDQRDIYYSSHVVEFTRLNLMQNLQQENLALIASRLVKGESPQHFHVTNVPTEKIFISSKTSNNAFVHPLYLYTTPETTRGTLFATTETTREPNLAPDFVRAVGEKLELAYEIPPLGTPFVPSDASATTFTPEDLFFYIYALFHSPTYRTRYAEFLKIDFPRVPLTSNIGLFRRLAQLGYELTQLHLLQSRVVNQLVTSFPIGGDNMVTKPTYKPSHTDKTGTAVAGRVYINKTQYFEGIKPTVWEFQIGGYQVLHKWLKDRKKRQLSFDDVYHYQRVVVALQETIRLMAAVDTAIPTWPIS